MIFKTFPQAGYTVIRSRSGLVLTFDHGPLGLPPLYNHGHADALAITLSLNGRALLVDPGTYRYNGVPAWRRYFKGTRAHNTVTVDGQDQAVQETGFIWSRPFTATLSRAAELPDGLLWEAVHDGYQRLPEPVIHYRTLFYVPEKYLLLRDRFAGTGRHDFELNFHLHPEARLRVQGTRWVATHGRENIWLELQGDEFEIITGQQDPPLGWFSPAYGSIRKSSVLSCRRRGEPSQIIFLTLISLRDQPATPELWERARSL